MEDMPEAHDLVAHARDTRVVVIGGGLAGSVAALACAKVGMTVTLLEATERLGGVLGPVDLAGTAVDPLDDDFAPDDADLTALLDELGLSQRVHEAPVLAGWIGGVGGAHGASCTRCDSPSSSRSAVRSASS
ncbi:MAG: FAD-dependent oxidoreductase, partial [Microbacterium sp.]